MSQKTVYIQLSILFLLICILTACSPDPIYVGCYVNELIDAINTANASPNPDIIELEADCLYPFRTADNTTDEYGSSWEGNPANALPVITTTITINGNNARFVRHDRPETPDMRFFLITGDGDLTINDLHMMGGKLFSYQFNLGGAIFNFGSVLTLNNVEFLQNSVSHYGGAINNGNGTVSLTDSSFRDNSADSGGAISNGGTLEIGENNIFENNSADIEGGAIANSGNLTISGPGSSMSLYSNQFVTNTAGDEGGAIFSFGGGPPELTIQSASFSENTSGGDGGAIYAEDDHTTFMISESAFIGNQTVEGGGGGIRIESLGTTLVNIVDTLIKENTAIDGGAILSSGSSVEIRSSNFSNNTSSSSGGAIFDQGGTFLLDNVTMEGNSAEMYGGGIYVLLGDFSISGSTIKGNYTQENGGGLYNRDGNITLTRETIFEGNTAQGTGGGINNASGTIHVEDSIIRDNDAPSGGGGIFNSSDLWVKTSTISGNTTDRLGGGINNQSGSNLEVLKSTIKDNVAGLKGGGIYHAGTSFKLVNSTISRNEADYSPGIGIFGETIIVHSTIAYNFGFHSSGAGIEIINLGNLQIKNSIVARNSPRDCFFNGTFTPISENLNGDGTCTGFTITTSDPGISPLANYGGPTETHALESDSPAIDAVPTIGDCSTIDGTPVDKDQRGVSRPQPFGGLCDLGAYEFEPSNPPPPPPPQAFLLKTTTDVNCRIGPHFDHVVVQTFTSGETALAIGRNEDGSWFGVAAPDGISGQEEPWCWLPDAFVLRPFEPADLPELDHLPDPHQLLPKEPTEEPEDNGCIGGTSACP